MSIRTLFLLLVVLLGWTTSADAQLPLPLAQPGLDLRARASGLKVAITPDGGAIVAHEARWIGGTLERPRLFRMRADGSVDTSWQVEVDGIVRDVAVIGDEVYLAGTFSLINGQARRGLALVSLATGGLTDWNPNAGSTSTYDFRSILVQDEAVFLGGNFTAIGSTARTHLARLDRQSGTVDPNFNPNVSETTAPAIVSIVSDGSDLFVAGSFLRINGSPRFNIAKLSRTTGAANGNWTPIFDGGQIRKILLRAGQLYVAGCFTQVSGVARSFIARVSPLGAGELDTTWNPVPNSGCVNGITADLTHVYVSGAFTQINGMPAVGYARLGRTGTGALDSTWQPNPDGSTIGIDAQPLPAGSVILIGDHVTIQGSYSPGIARVSSTGGALLTPAVYGEVPGSVRALAPAPDGGTYVGGFFHRIGSTFRSGILRLDSDSRLDLNWNTTPAFGGGGVEVVRVDGQHLYLGGEQRAGSLRNLFRVTHTGVTDSSWAPNPDGAVLALDVDEAAERVYAGGKFSTIGGQNRNRVAELSRQNATVTSFNLALGGGSDTRVRTILRIGNDIYLGGFFTAVNNLSRFNLAKVSRAGIVDPGFVANSVDEVRSLLPGPNGTLYVAGNLARILQSNGAPDPTWNTFANSTTVQSLAATENGLYVAGAFERIGNQTQRYLARISHAGVVDPFFAPTLDHPIDVVLERGNRVLAGGPMPVSVLAYPRAATPVATTLSITRDHPESTLPHQFYRVELNAIADGNIPLANQRIQVECDSGAHCEATLDASGNGACELASRTPGIRTLTARWSGAPLFLPATDSELHEVEDTTTTPPVNPDFDLRAPATVNALTKFSDGSLLIAGTFNRIGETPRRGLARLRADGSADPTYSADVIGSVTAVARDAADNAYVVGDFRSIDGVSRRDIAKLNANGDVVAHWNAATREVNRSVAHVDVNGDLILVESRPQQPGSPVARRNRLLKLSGSTGELISNFDVEVSVQNSTATPTFNLAGDGTYLYIYGSFDTVNNLPRRNLARLFPNGSLDSSWDPSPNFLVQHLTPDGSGGIYLTGNFIEIAGQSVPRGMARLDANGALISSFNPAPNGSVRGMVLDGNALYVHGGFTQIGGISRSPVAKLDAITGTADAGFSIPALKDPNFFIFPSHIERLGNALWVPANVIFANGTTVSSIGALRVDALTAAPLSVSHVTRQATVLALTRQPDGATLIGGRFARVGGAQRNLARITPEGQLDHSFAPALSGISLVRALLVRGNGEIYAGGFQLSKISPTGTIEFLRNLNIYALADGGDGLIIGGEFSLVVSPSFNRTNIAKVDYATGNAFTNWGRSANQTVHALATDSEGRVYLGGDFGTVWDQPFNGLARFNADGFPDFSWRPTASMGGVRALMVQGTHVYVGGSFSLLNSVSRSGIGRVSIVDGALSTWNPVGADFPPGIGFPTVRALARAQDGSIIAGGNFRFLGGAYRSNVVKLDPQTGMADPVWNPSTSAPVNAVLAGYGSTPVSIRRPDVEQNIAIGGEFEFMSTLPASGFVAISNLSQAQTIFCSNFESDTCN
jgi:hypothetical protein